MEGFKQIGARAGLTFGAAFGLVVMGVLMAGPSSAAVGDDPTADSIAALGTKVATYGAAMVAVVVIGVGIMLGLKYLKKAASKA